VVVPALAPGPEDVLDGHALRDWGLRSAGSARTTGSP
jgi:hypothetical protein